MDSLKSKWNEVLGGSTDNQEQDSLFGTVCFAVVVLMWEAEVDSVRF
jgi:hypothetical protein